MGMTEDELSRFREKLDDLAGTVDDLLSQKIDERNTEAYLLEPFLIELGYNVHDYRVAKKEFKAGFGETTTRKADYTLFDSDGRPQVLIECKRLGIQLLEKHAEQLSGYFNATDARIGILTNGANYEIYLDIDKINVMDEEPFFKFDLTELDEDDQRVIAQLARRADGSFDIDGFKSKAKERETQKRYKPKAKQIFEDWLTQPSKELATLLEKRLEAPEGSLHELAQGWFVEFVNSKMSTQTIKTPNGGERNGGEESELTPLPEWLDRVDTRDDLPPDMKFPDGESDRIDKAFHVPVKTTVWLIDNDYLTSASLPIHTSSGTILVSDKREDFKPYQRPKEVSNVFVNTNFPAVAHVENAQTIIEHAGLDPREFKGEFS